MTTQDQQNGQTEKPVPENLGVQGELVNSSRRRAMSGLATSGVLLSVLGQSGMALGCECATPSGSLSGGLTSHHGGKTPNCTGKTPSYWCGTTSWPSGCHPSNQFHTKFPACTPPSGCCYGLTLNETCAGDVEKSCSHSAQQHQCCQYLCAAYLNACEGLTPVLTPTQVVNIHTEWCNTGYFSPTAGVRWGTTEICNYLQGTWSST